MWDCKWNLTSQSKAVHCLTFLKWLLMVWYDLQKKLTLPWKPLATSHDQKVLLYLVLGYSVQFIMWRFKRDAHRTSLVIQWLRLYTPGAGGMDLIPDQRTEIPHVNSSKKKKKEREREWERCWQIRRCSRCSGGWKKSLRVLQKFSWV